MLRRDEIVQEFENRNIPIDLLIADEAHYMRNSSTATYNLGEKLTDSADAVLFLTATPLHLGNQDLYQLLHLLLPGEYDSLDFFQHQIRPNQYINLAAKHLAAGDYSTALTELRKVEKLGASERFLRNPFYHEVVEALKTQVSDREKRIRLHRDLIELNTLSTVFFFLRKREVVNAAVRAPVAVMIQLTPQEREFYLGVVRHVRLELQRSGSTVHSFSIIARERMAASCLAAMREAFEEAARLKHGIKAEIDTPLFDTDPDEDPVIIESVNELRRLSLAIGKHDSKFDQFRLTLNQALREGEDSKALVFSFYRGTLNYLHRRLVEAGYTVEVIHGGVHISDRQTIIERFRTDPDLKVLLSSEVGAEGLDFQFCDILINYDLPWNPMQVEQRIGRLDRFGQKHKRIRIYNFFIEDTIESRILQRLFDRIDIFRHAIGDLEDILGEQIRVLSKRVLQRDLTPEEEIRLADEAANQIVERQRANEELEVKKDELLGQDAIFNQQVNEAVSSGRTIHADEVRALVETFLKAEFENVDFIKDDEEATYTLDFTPQLAAHLQDFARSNPNKRFTTSTRFHAALAQQKRIALTFDNDLARERNLLELVTHQHLLTVAAMEYWSKKLHDGQVPAVRLTVEGAHAESGDGYFFIYAMDEHGLSSKRTLYPIIVLDNGEFAVHTSSTLLSQLQTPPQHRNKLDDDKRAMVNSEATANRWIAGQRDEIRFTSNKRHKALLSIREASIGESYAAKIRRAEQMRQTVHEPRIKRLYEGRINNLAAERDVKIRALRKKETVTVSHALIAAGRVRLVPVEHPVLEISPTPQAIDVPVLDPTPVITASINVTHAESSALNFDEPLQSPEAPNDFEKMTTVEGNVSLVDGITKFFRRIRGAK